MDNKKMMLLSFLIAILSIMIIIIVIPKINFTSIKYDYNDEKELTDIMGVTNIPKNCYSSGEYLYSVESFIDETKLCENYDNELQDTCFNIVEKDSDCPKDSSGYSLPRTYRCYKLEKYTCTPRSLDEYNLSCKDFNPPRQAYAVLSSGLDAKMCNDPSLNSLMRYTCYINDGQDSIEFCRYNSPCYRFIMQQCTRTLKSKSNVPQSNVPQKEFDENCKKNGNGKFELESKMKNQLCGDNVFQNKNEYICYAKSNNSCEYINGYGNNCWWDEYACKKNIKENAPPKPVSNCKAGDTCCEILGNGFVDKLHKNVLGPLKIIAPILLLVFTAIDFAKIVFSDNKDGMAKAWKNFGRRAVATILIFFAWNIVAIIYGFISGVGMCTGL